MTTKTSNRILTAENGLYGTLIAGYITVIVLGLIVSFPG